MSKRFYENVTVEESPEGFVLMLDQHLLKTPAKNNLVLPNEQIAQLLAQEWAACEEKIDPMAMPYNRLVNTSFDRVPDNIQGLADEFMAYTNNDLLCYFASHPDSLVARQHEIWKPLLDWCNARFDVSLKIVEGIQPIEQSPETLARMRHVYLKQPEFTLRMGALSHATALMGSAVLALALEAQEINYEQAYQAAFLDEHFQMEQWGIDEEAQKRLLSRQQEIDEVSRFFGVLG
ncbi:MAG: ATP12 family chaperone protein [Parvibaculales bacterium]